jgi:HD-GYP domain-containing protein (c-di-GMP phosphodiesterase class II)
MRGDNNHPTKFCLLKSFTMTEIDLNKFDPKILKNSFQKISEIINVNELLLKKLTNSNFNIDEISKLVFGKILKNHLNPKGPTHALFGSFNKNLMFSGKLYLHSNSKLQIESVNLDINYNKIKLFTENEILWSNFTNKTQTINDYQKKFDTNLKNNVKNPIRNFISYKFSIPHKDFVLCAFNYPKNINKYDAEIFKGFAISLQFFELFNYQLNELEKTHLDIITRIQMLSEKREPRITGTHLERVKNYARILATELSKSKKFRNIIDEKFIDDIYNAASLHDIGKVGIPDSILNKEDLLTEEEFKTMQNHTIIGGEVLKNSHYLSMARDIALYHQEKYDGAGYPRGLKGEAIPLPARIVCLADVFDALSTQRTYKKSISFDKVKDIILKESGHHFDPDVVEAFLNCEEKFVKISKKYS